MVLNGLSPRKAMQNYFSGFSGKTDEQGGVTINNLPQGPQVGYSVTHERFDMPIGDRHRAGSVELTSGKEQVVQVHMQLKGVDAVGK